ncbi:MAG: DUF4416 family protein [Deltaproteobacteria bacterium]|nr:DUF4416 family protein [Deltaproteobacteria bacterium]
MNRKTGENPGPLAQPFAAVLHQGPDLPPEVLEELRRSFGSGGAISSGRPFGHTEYYRAEMGDSLHRTLVEFTRLVIPDWLVEARLEAQRLEDMFRRGDGGRRVNIDMGYLDLFKVVLASFKERGNKIYLGRGVWADMTLVYQNGRFENFAWTFPDFADGGYHEELLRLRRNYKERLRGQETTD